jgi:hypothetical protein
MKLYREEMDVVAITPFTVDVIIPALAFIVLELIIEEVEVTPLTIDVNSLTADVRAF